MTPKCRYCPIAEGRDCPAVEAVCAAVAADPRKADALTRRTAAVEPSLPSGERPSGLARELVVARYREDLAWVEAAPCHVTIYDKGPRQELAIPHRRVPMGQGGREASAYLTHLCLHYDDLAEWTFFAQGDGTTHSEDLLERIAWTGYTEPTSLTVHYLPDFPPAEIKAIDLVEQLGPFAVHYGDALADQGLRTDGRPSWFNPSAWSRIFAAPMPRPLWFGYAAMWAVPRSAILRRPRDFWAWLLQEVRAGDLGRDAWNDAHPITPWSIEVLWKYLWSDLPTHYEQAPKSYPSLGRQLANAAGAAARFATSGAARVDRAEYDRRRSICQLCPELDSERSRCRKCGCAIAAKPWMKSETCPLGKW